MHFLGESGGRYVYIKKKRPWVTVSCDDVEKIELYVPIAAPKFHNLIVVGVES